MSTRGFPDPGPQKSFTQNRDRSSVRSDDAQAGIHAFQGLQDSAAWRQAAMQVQRDPLQAFLRQQQPLIHAERVGLTGADQLSARLVDQHSARLAQREYRQCQRRHEGGQHEQREDAARDFSPHERAFNLHRVLAPA